MKKQKNKKMSRYSVGFWVGLYIGLFYCLILSIINTPLSWDKILVGIITFSIMGGIVKIMGGYDD